MQNVGTRKESEKWYPTFFLCNVLKKLWSFVDDFQAPTSDEASARARSGRRKLFRETESHSGFNFLVSNFHRNGPRLELKGSPGPIFKLEAKRLVPARKISKKQGSLLNGLHVKYNNDA